MIQDIQPKKFRNEFEDKNPSDESFVMLFCEKGLLLKEKDGEILFPEFKEFKDKDLSLTFAFKIDGDDYFIGKYENEEDGYTYKKIFDLRYSAPKWAAFAGLCAYHVFCWYNDNKFCGRCGNKMAKSEAERALVCPGCKNTIYPKLCPAVIVAVTNKDSIIMTKYTGRQYKNYALIAGFAEFGETIEETVKREVKEEVGLDVKNLRYYKSQPWALSSSLLMGFFAEVDGDTKITMDEAELKEAEWFKRDEMPVEDDGVSLTREMMMAFKNKEM